MKHLCFIVFFLISTYPVRHEAQSNYGAHLASKDYVNTQIRRFLGGARKSLKIQLEPDSGGDTILQTPPGKTILNGKIGVQGLWAQARLANRTYILVSLLAGGATRYFPTTSLYETYPINSTFSKIAIDFAGPYNASTSTGLIQFDYVEMP
jgi:hypothetical protein